LQALRDSHTTRVHRLEPEQRARLRQAVEPVQQILARRIGRLWVDRLKLALTRTAPG